MQFVQDKNSECKAKDDTCYYNCFVKIGFSHINSNGSTAERNIQTPKNTKHGNKIYFQPKKKNTRDTVSEENKMVKRGEKNRVQNPTYCVEGNPFKNPNLSVQ